MFLSVTSPTVKLKRGQTEKRIQSSRLHPQNKLSYLKSNQKNKSIRNVSTYCFNKELDRLRIYQKEIEEAFAKQNFVKEDRGKEYLKPYHKVFFFYGFEK